MFFWISSIFIPQYYLGKSWILNSKNSLIWLNYFRHGSRISSYNITNTSALHKQFIDARERSSKMFYMLLNTHLINKKFWWKFNFKNEFFFILFFHYFYYSYCYNSKPLIINVLNSKHIFLNIFILILILKI